ncbi:MAG: lipoyl(octanoyl) transferase LipB [Thermodesulfobacteriota bacterium]
MKNIDVKRLGSMDYQAALELQLDYLEKRINGEINDTLIFLQHTPTITIGRKGNKDNLLISEKILEQKKIKYYEVNRGGDITYHGPGQLVCYPIIDLKDHTKDVHKYLRTLEQIIIDVLLEFDIEARRIEGLTGVFIKNSKIASIGVGIKRWVTFHGLSLNINTDLSYFDLIVPCGLNNNPVTSIKSWNKLQDEIDLSIVEDRLIKGFTKYFH